MRRSSNSTRWSRGSTPTCMRKWCRCGACAAGGHSLRGGVSTPCHLYDRLGRGAGRRGTVHRLQVLPWPPAPTAPASGFEDPGVIEKCRFALVRGRAGQPAGVHRLGTCISGARLFGGLDDPQSEICQEIAAAPNCPAAGGRPDHRENLLREVMINGLGIYDRLVPVFWRAHRAGAFLASAFVESRSIPTA